MIHWLVQSTSAHPELERGQPPLGLLSASELAHFHALRTPKRRHDWLLGRWTAKHLVQSYLAETMGQRLALDSIEIKNEEDGSPFVELHEQHPTHQPARDAASTYQRLAACVTISHCEEWAFCAVTTQIIGGHRARTAAGMELRRDILHRRGSTTGAGRGAGMA